MPGMTQMTESNHRKYWQWGTVQPAVAAPMRAAKPGPLDMAQLQWEFSLGQRENIWQGLGGEGRRRKGF